MVPSLCVFFFFVSPSSLLVGSADVDVVLMFGRCCCAHPDTNENEIKLLLYLHRLLCSGRHSVYCASVVSLFAFQFCFDLGVLGFFFPQNTDGEGL